MKKIFKNIGKAVMKTTKTLIASSIVIFGSMAIWALKHDARITIVTNR